MYINGKRMVRTGDTVSMNRGNTIGMIAPKTMPAPAGTSSNPPVTFETPEEQDFGAWFTANCLGDVLMSGEDVE